MKNESFVSVVMVTENDAALIGTLLREVHSHLVECFVDYEIVVVDQKSTDGTQRIIDELLAEIPSLRFIELAFAVGHDVASAAALENAIGDFVVIFSPRNDPASSILNMVKQCREGADIVVGVAVTQFSFAYRLIRPAVYRLLTVVGYDVPKNATKLRCLSRRAVNAVTRAGRFHHQLFVRIQKTGYPFSTFNYLQTAHGERKTLTQGMREVLRLFVFNSTRPLRWMSGLGVAVSAIAFGITLYGLVAELVTQGFVANWRLPMLFIAVMFSIVFAMLAFFGEYMGRLLDDRGEQNLYSVAYEKTSSVAVGADRVNVLNESVAEQAVHLQVAPNIWRGG